MNGNRKIIGLYGTERRSRNRVAKVLTQLFKYTEVRLSQSLEHVVNVTFGIKLEQIYGDEIPAERWKYSPRQLLEGIGERLFNDKIWLRLLSMKLEGNGCNVVIPEVKTLDEIKLIKSLGGEVFWVDKPGDEFDSNFAHYDFDGRIIDIGTDDDLIYMVFKLIVRNEYSNLHM